MVNSKNHDLQKNKSCEEVICTDKDLKAYYQPAVKFFEILLGWEMEKVHEKDKKSKEIQTTSQFKKN